MKGRRPRREAEAHEGILEAEDEEETLEMHLSPVSNAIEELMEEMNTMTPARQGSGDSLEQQSPAEFTPCSSEGSRGDAWTPAVASRSDEEPMSEEKQPKQVQYGLEKFFFGKKVKPAIEEHKTEILKDEGLLKRGRGRPTKEAAALMEARKNGEVLAIAAVKDFNKAVEEEAARMLKMKKKVNSPCGAEAQIQDLKMRTCAVGVGAMLLVKNSNRALKGATKKKE